MSRPDIALEDRIIFALDLADPREALALVDRLAGRIRFFKVGLQLFFAGGWPVVDYIVAKGCKVMLDLKLYDIPATVRLAVRQFADRGITSPIRRPSCSCHRSSICTRSIPCTVIPSMPSGSSKAQSTRP